MEKDFRLFQRQSGWRAAPLVEGLHSVHGTLGSIPTLHTPGVVAQVCHPSTREVKVGGSEVQSHPQLQRECKARLGLRKW